MARNLLIIGAGGHGRVVADIAKRQGVYNILGFMDDNQTGIINGVPCLGPIDSVESILQDVGTQSVDVVIGIGSNQIRKEVALRISKVLSQYGVSYATVVDPSAVVSSHAQLGHGTVVLPNAVVNANAFVGEHVIINTAATVDHDCCVQDFAHLSPGVHLAGDVWVGEGTHLGIGAVVIPGIRIGCWSIIGAGSVVVRDIPDGVTAYGVPCRVH